MGACPRCDGLGHISFFDPKRVVAYPHLIARLRRDSRLGQAQSVLFPDAAVPCGALRIRSRGRHSRNCRSRCRRQFCRARARKRSGLRYIGERGNKHHREHTFEGVIPNLERRYRETDSIVVREELAKYLNSQVCPECARHTAAAGSAQCASSPARRSMKSAGSR